MNAGLRPLWGIENDPDIAEVANRNLGNHVLVVNILDTDPSKFEVPDVLHASPPCPSFSKAKVDGKETDHDIALAQKVADFVRVLHPSIFTLENVYLYRKSHSWKLIAKQLSESGYWFDVAHVNAADFGVPQTRKRMIVRATKGRMVPWLPEKEEWVGWYEVIKDLIDDLPETKFAPWQLEKLSPNGTVLVDSAGFDDEDGGKMPVTRESEEPANTVLVNHGGRGMKAFVLSNANTEWGDGVRNDDDPIHTVTEQTGGRTRAFLVSSQSIAGEEPAIRSNDYPAVVVDTKHGRTRAFVVDGKPANFRGDLQVKRDNEPTVTISANSPKHPQRAWLGRGRVVKMTPRALARFQTFPDWFKLPKNDSLACRGIGNAVPCLLYEKIVRQLLCEG